MKVNFDINKCVERGQGDQTSLGLLLEQEGTGQVKNLPR